MHERVKLEDNNGNLCFKPFTFARHNSSKYDGSIINEVKLDPKEHGYNKSELYLWVPNEPRPQVPHLQTPPLSTCHNSHNLVTQRSYPKKKIQQHWVLKAMLDA